MQKQYFVYIATNYKNTVLYTGVTNSLVRRMYEHKNGLIEGFTKKYKINRLVFYETFNNPKEAILAEKTIKGGRLRIKKLNLIKKGNPKFLDLLSQILRFAQDDK